MEWQALRLALQGSPNGVWLELARFCGLVPLARMDFRLGCMDRVTASDASITGGGACVSKGLTAYGAAAANATVRGDLPEAHDLIQVLSVGYSMVWDVCGWRATSWASR